jgi:hypothetical protein
MLQDGLVAFLPGASIGNFRIVGNHEVFTNTRVIIGDL